MSLIVRWMFTALQHNNLIPRGILVTKAQWLLTGKASPKVLLNFSINNSGPKISRLFIDKMPFLIIAYSLHMQGHLEITHIVLKCAHVRLKGA